MDIPNIYTVAISVIVDFVVRKTRTCTKMEGIDKLSRIPPYIRRRIVTLNENGLNNCKIVKYMILSLEKTICANFTSRDIVIFETI
jgi:hypothetical protein